MNQLFPYIHYLPPLTPLYVKNKLLFFILKSFFVLPIHSFLLISCTDLPVLSGAIVNRRDYGGAKAKKTKKMESWLSECVCFAYHSDCCGHIYKVFFIVAVHHIIHSVCMLL